MDTNSKLTIKPLEWTVIHPKSEVAASGLIEIHECEDGTWRVNAYPFDDKIRNLPNKEAAKAAANERWVEFVKSQIILE